MKTYQYIVSEKIWKNIEFGRLSNGKGEWYRPYRITNSEGYTYRSSKVIFLAWKPFEGRESGFKKLINFESLQCINFSVEPALSIIGESSRLLKEGWSISHDETVITSSNINSNCCISSTTTSASSGTATNGTLQYNGNDWLNTTPYTSTTTGWTYVSNIDYGPTIAEIQKRLDKLENNKKEKSTMFENLTKNLKCGRAQDVRMSIYGPAFKGEDGNWYAVGTDDILTDVSDLLLDMDSYCYMMPVAKNQVKVGDFILHNGRWTKVISVDKERVEGALDIFKKEFIVPALTKSPFGFEFYTKLVPLLDFSKFQASTDTPFGALPMILVMNNKNDKDILPMLMMMGTQGGFNFDMSNPMMMYFLMKDGGNDSLLPFLMMNQMNKADN